MLIFTLWTCASTSLFLAHAQNILISEFLANNRSGLKDEDGEFSDWIEILNGDSLPVNLAGWFLTDTTNNLTKWPFPSISINANGYLVVFASGKDRAKAGSPLHTSFSLGAGGEYLALVRPGGVSPASEYSPNFPEQYPNISYGVAQNGLHYFSTPTPGAPNSSGFLAFVEDTKFSQDRGFYTAPFLLAITTATTNAVIRYTTNGTPPSATNGTVYTGPISINRTTTLRAAAFKAGFEPSNADTQTYIFLDDVIRQSPTGQAPSGWPSTWGANTVDYGMDPDVVNNTRYSGTIKNDLQTLPSFSIVLDLKDLFNASTGIYANPGQDGIAWERPCSIELINPDGSKGFQVNAGLRIRGGFSRATSNPKHAFRFLFREEYGDAKLHFPLFGDDGTDVFDAIDLRTFQNYSWSFQGDSRGVFLRDQFSRDTQLEMGHQGERGNFYHLYINGQYWGLYNTCERPEASFGETYYGGNKDDYDVIKVEAGSYALNATDGNMSAWTRLYNLALAGLATDAAYQRVQGNNPDGTPNTAYENLVDVDNLIDYMLVIIYGGNLDAPISNFLSNTSPNNWYGIRNRIGQYGGFRFFAHDAEHTLLDVNQNRTGPFTAGDTSVTKSSPQWIWQKMWANAEFKILAADHIHRHFFNNGALTVKSATNRFMARKAEIDRAVVGESARWGDAKRTAPFTRDGEWIAEINRIVNSYMPQRSGIVLNQLRSKNLYPNVTAPSFNQHGGNVPPGFSLTMSAPAGVIYYTLDGTDPRLRGGAVAPSARTYAGAIALTENVRVKSRVLSAGTWSALNEAAFILIQTFKDVAITEIMYHPPPDTVVDSDNFEFIELKNLANVSRDLSGAQFTNGVNYTFPNGSRVQPGQFIVLVSDPAAFAKRYPTVPIFGTYTGRLANGGEKISLIHAAGEPIASLEYSDKAPWPGSADGTGFSIVSIAPDQVFNPADPAGWRASSQMGGSPGANDPLLSIPTIWINEALTHTDPPAVDSIELHNPGASLADISNWYLTDDRGTPKKFRIPAGTVIPPGGFAVFTESDFNPNPGIEPSFTLSSHGEEVFLFSADAAGNLTGYSDGFAFSAAANGVSFGRYTNSIGQILYPPQITPSLGAQNSGPRVGPVVINEIQFQPAPGSEEFIELKNVSDSPVALYDPANPTNRWKLEGIGFTFPGSAVIPAKGFALLIPSDPAVFRSRNGVPASVPIFGPYPGTLQDNGELLQLERPDSPDVTTNGIVVPYIAVDEARYDNKLPWPTDAAGLGPSLERINPLAFGNDPVNWRASAGSASPGLDNNGNRPPIVNAGADLSLQSSVYPVVTNLAATVRDDGLPSGTLTFRWTQLSGPAAIAFSAENQSSTGISLPVPGVYSIRITASDGELQTTGDLTVTMERPPLTVTLLPRGSVWKYFDNNSNQGTAWRMPSFNDASWAQGKAQLGFGDSDEATVINGGPSSARYVTTYFRQSFALASKSAIAELTVQLLRDDGAVVYLNGIEIFRSNMPVGDITSGTFASSNATSDQERTTFLSNAVDPAVLVDGVNVLAVEVHQVNLTSSDLSFDLELSALSNANNQAPKVNAGPDQTIALPATATLSASVSDDGQPGPLSLSWSKVSGPGSVSFANPSSAATTAQFSQAGTYTLRLVASDGALSAQDELAVTVSAGAYGVWQAQYFTASELQNPAISGDNADPDGDLLTNLQEFTAGTNPKDAQSSLRIGSASFSLGLLHLRFDSIPGMSYTVQVADSLPGSWSKLRDVSSASGATTEVIEPATATTRFFRVVTPRQP